MKVKIIKTFALFLFSCVCLNASSLHVRLLEPFLGIKYRQYGTTNINEKYVLFTDKFKTLKKAGFGHNGFVYSAYKRLLGKSMDIDEVLQNSGKNYMNLVLKDDFSLKLALNIAKKHKNRFLNSSFCEYYGGDYAFDIYNIRRWNRVFKKLKKENIYLAIFSKHIRGKDKFSHLGIIIKDDNKNVFLYQSTPKYGVHKIWMDFDRKMSIFGKDIDSLPQKVLILELEI
ncbi:MAG: hypothetical protein KGV58_00995 [Campylobacteraceae bacterium]|nr:hypothetical protein [Campylobacteraceae bacterium]